MKTALLPSVWISTAAIGLSAPYSGVFGYFSYSHNATNTAVTITDYDPSGNCAEGFPTAIDGLPVTAIADNAFSNCPLITQVVVPNTVATIGNYTFSGCTGLVSAKLPDTITDIGINTFIGCGNLSTVSLPAHLAAIPNNTFRNCTSLVRISIPASVTSIGSSAFYGCSSFSGAIIPGGVTSIGNNAFNACTSLHQLYFEGPPPTVGTDTFSGTANLTAYRLLENPGWQSTLGTIPTSIWDRIIHTTTHLESGVFTIGFNTLSALSYRIESSSNLVGWEIEEDNIIGDNSLKQRSFSTEGHTRRFFRVLRN